MSEKATIVLSGAMLQSIVIAGIRTGMLDGVDKTGSVEVHATGVAISVTVNKILSAHTEPLEYEVVEQVATTEPTLRCGDTIIVAPCNDFGRELVAKYGNAWKVISGRSNKGGDNPHTWILNSVSSKKAGKFAGIDRKHISQESLLIEQGPLKWARVMFVCRFPNEFKWREYYAALKDKDITIERLNAVNFDKADGSKA